MKVLTGEEMLRIDKTTTEEIGIPSPVLMENAARGVLEVIERRFPKAKRILVIAGKGNNGGDGIALTRMLLLKGRKVDLFLPLGEPKGDALLQLRILRNLGFKELEGEPDLKNYDLIVDAIFGTGFLPPLKGKVAKLIERVNTSGVPVVAVDIPSGLWASSGEVFEPSVRAALTVTFQFPKVCHLLYPSAKLCGEVEVVDISIPNQLAEDVWRETIEPYGLTIPRREKDTYKNREGHVLILGGSRGKTGAVIMAAKAATRTGSGLVTVGIPKELNEVIESVLIEEMSLPLEGSERLSLLGIDRVIDVQETFSAAAVGMGMGRYEEGQDILREILLRWEKPLLIDADGINNLADLKELDILRERKAPTVLTPHVGEFSRLTGVDPKEVAPKQFDIAKDFATRYGCYLVLKAARTVLATPEGKAYISLRGTPAMAKGGVGDILSGILVSLMGKMPIEEALKLGVYLHGLAGEIAQARTHTESLRATDIIEAIPEAYRTIEKLLNPADNIKQDDR